MLNLPPQIRSAALGTHIVTLGLTRGQEARRSVELATIGIRDLNAPNGRIAR
jgi:hypothetical protein